MSDIKCYWLLYGYDVLSIPFYKQDRFKAERDTIEYNRLSLIKRVVNEKMVDLLN